MRWIKTPILLQKLFTQIIWRIPNDENAVFLTFDDGPTPEVTDFVLEELKKYNAKATFFLIGEKAALHKSYISKILEAGHSVGNHTYNHLSAWSTPNEHFIENIKKTDAVFSSTLFRFPYGKIKMRGLSKILDKKRIIGWDILAYDWDAEIDVEKTIETIVKETRSGSILVFHDSLKAEKNLRKMLPEILKKLQEKHFSFWAIS